jgi:hypothetical protein
MPAPELNAVPGPCRDALRASRRYRPLFVIACAFALAAPASAADKPRADLEKEFRDSVRPFVATYCLSCHSGAKPKADVDLGRFTTPESVGRDFPQWEIVAEQLKSADMPPKDAKKQPAKDERQRAIAWVERFRKFEAERLAGDPGPVLARRLSNAEFDYTVRDLTGVDIRPAREFPVDPANGAGFDNSGESLAMSPALVTKYLAAARLIADHLILKTEGFAFAPFPVRTDTDRDKYGVRNIIDFYQRQPIDLADYFRAAWEFKHRAKLGRPQATLAECASAAKVSPKYLALIWATLTEVREEIGPTAALQAMWQALDEPGDNGAGEHVRTRCEGLRDFVRTLRDQVKVKVRNLGVPGMGGGSQSLVLWKDREMAANRRNYGGDALRLKVYDLTELPASNPDELRVSVDEPFTKFLVVPKHGEGRERFESAFKRFCSVFPDAFFVSERGRVFLDPKGEKGNTGRLLSAGFHNQMGYFRDDQPLCELILDEAGKRTLDELWDDFEFASDVPFRMHAGFLWFERAESKFGNEAQFDFARPEDRDTVSPAKLKKYADLYIAKVKKVSKDEVAIKAVEEYFVRVDAKNRWFERTRLAAEPSHLKALQDFAERAYRRRLTAQERTDIVGFYRAMRKDESVGHEDAVRDTLVSILMSPKFCFRVDLPLPGGATKPGEVQPLADEALASRLSYFLWSSMPDAELMGCAMKGTLHQPAVLLAQTRRMLQDDRIRGLAVQFGGNWLDFRRFDEHNAVDRYRFLNFDNDLREAMYEEPIRFITDLVRHDGAVLDMLDGKHTFVNKSLAKHYGMPLPAKPGEWVRVENADKYGRGGILPMAVFLTKNAPGLRTSPVKRGYWVVTRLLGERIPPPPPTVPELPADEKNLGNLTLREALARHRADKNCAGCHARFDSFGLAFEGFGPIGERRTADLAGRAVDTHVGFPNGAEGNGVDGLRDYVRRARQNDYLDNLCRKLLSYALGRGLQLSDDVAVGAMRTQLARNDNRFSNLVETIVTSPQFLNKRSKTHDP